jgi:hypothetical protein
MYELYVLRPAWHAKMMFVLAPSGACSLILVHGPASLQQGQFSQYVQHQRTH